MAESLNTRCARCGLLFSLSAEVCIITITIVHVLATVTEELVHLEVIQVPGNPNNIEEGVVSTTTAPNATTAGLFDPGGEDCDFTPNHDSLIILVLALRYFTLVVSALFMVEILCKAVYKKIEFVKDPWLVFDAIVVLASLGAEIAFFLLHDRLLCYNLAIEVISYVVIFRLWRIPRACNIRKKEYSERLDNEITHLRKTRMEADIRYGELQQKFDQQNKQLQKLEIVASIPVEFRLTEENTDSSCNTSAARDRGFGRAIKATTIPSSAMNGDVTVIRNGVTANGHVPRASADVADGVVRSTDIPTRNGSPGARTGMRSNREKPLTPGDQQDGGVGVGPVGADEVFVDSDGSETPEMTRLQQVEVQIEEVSRQPQLPSISRSLEEETDDDDGGPGPTGHENLVQMRKKGGLAAGYVNGSFVDDNPSKTGDSDGTYRSAEGIPITEL